MDKYELRFLSGKLTSDGNSLSGIASPYFDGTSNTEYQLRENIYERYAPECFHLRDQVPVVFNHDEEKVLGIAPRTAKVWCDGAGLHYEVANLPDTSYARDLKALIQSGNIQGSSVRMIVEADEWKREGDRSIRNITKASIFHVSPVFLPAYEKTQTNLRSYEEFKERELTEIYQQRLNKIIAQSGIS